MSTRLEAELFGGTGLLKSIVDGCSDAIYVKDLEGRFVLCNATASHILGRPLSEIIGKTCSELVPREVAEVITATDQRVLASGVPETEESRLVLGGDQRTAVLLTTRTPHRAPDGTIIGLIAIARDITERVALAERIRHGESMFALAVDAMPVGVIVIDAHGDLTFANAAAQKIWGQPILEPGTVRWRKSRAWWKSTGKPVEPHEWASVRALVEGVPQLEQLLEIEGFDGVKRTVRNSAVPIGSHGGVERAVIVIEDITERTRLEERLAETGKIEVIGRLAGSVAHDFNNLLTIIMSYVELVDSELAGGDPRHADLAEIQKAAESAAALTRQLLAFGRREAVRPQVVRLEEVVTGAERMLGRLIGEHVRVRMQCAAEPNVVRIDPSQIEQIVLNLAVNARDAMPDGGDITIVTRALEYSDEEARSRGLAAGGRFARLDVSDTGLGMDAETRAHIFEPLFTTKSRERGTGLGLATVHGIVEQAGGAITVDTAPDRGTTFHIDLPIVTPVDTFEGAHSKESRDAAALRGSERVLLVEDSAPVRLAVRAGLERFGYRVHDVGDAAAALAYVVSPDVGVDLLLTDVVLPSMSGRALAAEVASKRPDIRVLYISGYTDDDAAHGSAAGGGGPALAKPFTAEVLAGAVRAALQRP